MQGRTPKDEAYAT